MPLNEKDYNEQVNKDGFSKEFFEELYHLNTFNNGKSGQISRIVSFRERAKPLFKWFLDLNKLWKEEILNIDEYRIIDKTPPNVFRVEFINKVFPDAQFIYLKRSAEGNINSLIKAWQSKGKLFDFKFREFYEYNSKIDFEGYDAKVWKFINPPGWEKFLEPKYDPEGGVPSLKEETALGRTDSKNAEDGAPSLKEGTTLGRTDSRLLRMKKHSVARLHEHFEDERNAEGGVLKWSLKEVCEFQYTQANNYASKSLHKICEGLSAQERAKKVIEINYEDMIANKVTTFNEICDFLDIDFSKRIQSMIEKDPKVSRIKN